jgi:hypothetical protein
MHALGHGAAQTPAHSPAQTWAHGAAQTPAHSPGQTWAHGAAQAPAKAAVTRGKRKLMLIIAGCVVVVVALFAFAFAIYRAVMPKPPPPHNDKIEKIACFVKSGSFKKEPFDRQAEYLRVLDKRRNELKPARDEGKLSDEDYKAALGYAWIGKHLGYMQNWIEKSDAGRREYLKGLIEKKYASEGPSSKPADAGGPAASPRDKSIATDYPKDWPPEARAQWEEFRKAYKRAEKEYEKEHGLVDPGKGPGKGSGKATGTGAAKAPKTGGKKGNAAAAAPK